MSSGIHTCSFSCFVIGMPSPLFLIVIVPSTPNVTSIRETFLGCNVCWSIAFTKISSKILTSPDAIVTCARSNRSPFSFHVSTTSGTTDPMYESGRRKMCSTCVSFSYSIH